MCELRCADGLLQITFIRERMNNKIELLIGWGVGRLYFTLIISDK